jgi:hypothetical protein
VPVELAVLEQRYRAFLKALGGAPVTDMTAGMGWPRDRAWVATPACGRGLGIANLADRSSRPSASPHQMPPFVGSSRPASRVADVKALRPLCGRGGAPSFGPRRLASTRL